MDLNATVVINFVFLWVVVATLVAYFLAKTRVKSLALTVVANFFLGFIPPISLISLFLLANKKELEN